jgi:hypothetical protein
MGAVARAITQQMQASPLYKLPAAFEHHICHLKWVCCFCAGGSVVVTQHPTLVAAASTVRKPLAAFVHII